VVELTTDRWTDGEDAGGAAAAPAAPAAHELPPLGRLVTGDAAVAPDEPVERVAELFFATPALEAVAVVEARRPVGLLTRGRLLLKLARNFGHELYARKPVTRIADLSPLVLPADCSVRTAVDRALERDTARVYDEVIVADGGGRYVGYASVRELMQHQGAALERSTLEREAAVARARDLEQLDQLRARFLAHATHELRSPVNAIVALAELVRLSCERGDVAQVRARIPVLLRSASTLRGTVNNILDLSKLEAGRMDVAVAPVDLVDLAGEVAATARLLVGEKPIEVRVEAPPVLVVSSDAQKLRQILVNLVSNAAKFTEVGHIVLAIRVAADGAPSVAVSDTGCGIAEEDLARLFVPFGQLEEAATKSHAGTGLGLAITRSLAALLGGTVAVESRRGAGSTFTLQLPSPPRSDTPT
jgi:signal transduction histidine kinase